MDEKSEYMCSNIDLGSPKTLLLKNLRSMDVDISDEKDQRQNRQCQREKRYRCVQTSQTALLAPK